jgi:hypothetical protein
MPRFVGRVVWCLASDQAWNNKDPRVQASGYVYWSNALQVDSVYVKPVAVIDSVQALDKLPAVVASDFDWFHNYVASQGGSYAPPQATELDAFVVSYQRYLYLLCKYERKVIVLLCSV